MRWWGFCCNFRGAEGETCKDCKEGGVSGVCSNDYDDVEVDSDSDGDADDGVVGKGYGGTGDGDSVRVFYGVDRLRAVVVVVVMQEVRRYRG